MNKLYSGLGLGLLSLGFMFVSPVSSYANTAVETSSYLVQLDKDGSGHHLVNENGNWYMKDINEEVVHGWSFDNNGNLYRSGTPSGELVINGLDSDGNYYDTEGKFHVVDPSKLEYFKGLCPEFEANGSVVLGSKEDCVEFLNYYSANYRLHDSITLWNFPACEGGYEILLNPTDNYDMIENKIFDTFGHIDKNLPTQEKVYEACARVIDYFEYDKAYTELSMNECIDNKKGVCWHYTKCVQKLLQDAGVEAECITGVYGDSEHIWLRINDNGVWTYCDPTLVESAWWTFMNTPLSTMTTDYSPHDYLHLR